MGGIAGKQKEMLLAQEHEPVFQPVPLAPVRRQDVAGDFIETVMENSPQATALLLVFQPRLERIDVTGSGARATCRPGVFMGGG